MIPSWMAVGAVTFLVALASGLTAPDDIRWFRRLIRPSWLTFEPAIPFIWTFIFICGAWGAVTVWETDPGSQKTWWLMGFYLLVEIAIIAYTPVMCKLRSLRAGTIIGATGTLFGLLLALAVWQVSAPAAFLLLPYLIWSPIGTYTTWEMIRLNPADQ
ncbi:MAG: TspO/MBR family protein [Oscillatoria princeps RMCB-10]|jgi:tryptophan-rich sensory protein|nr:TspO/MBR family protein [Oscillatoria princeps RMCB-10]